MRKPLAVTLSLVGIIAWTVTSDIQAAEIEVDLKTDVEYGSGGDQKLLLDLASPKGNTEALPLLVLIHGGGWQAGDKRVYRDLIQQCAAEGYVVASVGYRFSPKYRWPAQIEDCKCAVRYLRAHAAELKIDPNRVGAMGHSAGGHLSMMLGVLDTADGMEGEGGWADQPSKVQCVVSYFGPSDLTTTERDVTTIDGGDLYNLPILRGILTNLVGGPPSEHLDELKKASPLTYVNEGDAPTLLIQGTRDPLVPHDNAIWMADALTMVKVPGRVELVLGAGHGFPGPEGERLHRSSMAFFAEHLKPAAK